MNYKLHYEKLIEKARNRELDCYKERHHIVPRCLGGTDDESNLVDLTAREHFIAHILLVKIHPKEYGLIKAVQMMCIIGEGQEERKIHNRMYGWLKEKFSKEQSRCQSGEGNSQFGKVWVYNLEEKLSKKITQNELQNHIDDGWLEGRVICFDKYLLNLKKVKEKERIKEHEQTERIRLIESFISIKDIKGFRSIRELHYYLTEEKIINYSQEYLRKFLLQI